MRTCFLNEITVKENRLRKEFKSGPLRDLAEDIAKNGLYHPIVLTYTSIPPDEFIADDKPFELLAGERRFRAIKLLAEEGRRFTCDFEIVEPSLCPYVLITDLSEHAALEIELHENLLRSCLLYTSPSPRDS